METNEAGTNNDTRTRAASGRRPSLGGVDA